jgi:hypothetical protein
MQEANLAQHRLLQEPEYKTETAVGVGRFLTQSLIRKEKISN